MFSSEDLVEYGYWCTHIEAGIRDGRVLRVEGNWQSRRHAHCVAAARIKAVKLPKSQNV